MFKRPVKIPLEHNRNIDGLLVKVNRLRLLYGKPLIVTSGYRSLEEHLAIYAAKGITDQAKIPMKSKHLSGQAVDLVPADGDIKGFQKFISELVKYNDFAVDGLWFEDFAYTDRWTHAQSVPPKSGKRFFLP